MGSAPSRLLAATLLMALAAGVPAQAQNRETGPNADEPAPADLSAFDEVWRLVDENFFDPRFAGVDWEAARERHRPAAAAASSAEARSAAINAMLAELDTSHTAHFTPDDVAYYHLLDIFARSRPLRTRVGRLFSGEGGVRYTGLAAFVEETGGRTFVTGVWAGMNAERAGLKVGDELVFADGEPFHPLRSFRGKEGRSIMLSVRRSRDGPLETVAVTGQEIRPQEALLEAMENSVRVIEHDGSRIGYIRIWSYAGEDYQEALEEALSTGRLADADGLVVDLRGGWGGARPEYLAPFLPGPEMTFRGRGDEKGFAAVKWRKPVAVLIDEGTRSGKEVLAYGFRAYGLGPVIGEPTAGAVVAGRVYLLPDDSLLYLAVADVHIDGKRLEGVGVRPDIAVAFDPPYAGGADPQLERALAELARAAGG